MGHDNISQLHPSLAEVIVERVDLHDGDRVLGPACGTDQVARFAAQQYDMRIDVVGLDDSQSWPEGDWRALPFPDRRFDVVLGQDGLLDRQEPYAALRDIQRVLVPAGRLAFILWPEDMPRVMELADAGATATGAATNRRGDVEAIRKVMAGAGLHDVEIQEITVRKHEPWSGASIVDDLVEVDAEDRQANAYLVQAWTGGFWARFWHHSKTAWLKGHVYAPSPCCG